jgi:hypothetical protein
MFAAFQVFSLHYQHKFSALKPLLFNLELNLPMKNADVNNSICKELSCILWEEIWGNKGEACNNLGWFVPWRKLKYKAVSISPTPIDLRQKPMSIICGIINHFISRWADEKMGKSTKKKAMEEINVYTLTFFISFNFKSFTSVRERNTLMTFMSRWVARNKCFRLITFTLFCWEKKPRLINA